ncbi:hypothetical protein [Sphingomonas sp. SRS2]|uniref:hypothetical protein n=1 Tax=Sphingomonas sp. SRS2 TaxID=133190 RepID=UPI0006184EAA|nr:hypothetical protein [Sphingomonas sp. SRS2]KKC25210.1 hypothetical protein WP12_15140 [Sphingomonas sp. SRS2]
MTFIWQDIVESIGTVRELARKTSDGQGSNLNDSSSFGIRLSRIAATIETLRPEFWHDSVLGQAAAAMTGARLASELAALKLEALGPGAMADLPSSRDNIGVVETTHRSALTDFQSALLEADAGQADAMVSIIRTLLPFAST